jgi:hypothetical protein
MIPASAKAAPDLARNVHNGARPRAVPNRGLRYSRQ